MHVVIANRYFSPDISATSQLVSDLARTLQADGHNIEILTSRQLYGSPDAQLPSSEQIDGIQVHRLATTRFGRDSLWGKAADFVTFYISFFFKSLLILKRGSVLICCTDPPLLSIPGALVCLLHRSQLINWMQDIYPEVAVAVDVMKPDSLATTVLRSFRNWSFRRARKNIAIGEVMAGRVKDMGIDPSQLEVIHNWSLNSVTTQQNESPNLEASWSLEGKFVVQYSGNLGKAHDYQTILGAACALKADANIVFLIIGGGLLYEQLKTEASIQGATNILFKPYQPREILAASLALADIHLVTLRSELEGYIVPSKFYGVLASGKPTLFIGSAKGEVARIIETSCCGETIASGDAEGLAKAILSLCNAPEQRAIYAKNALSATATRYNREISLAEWRHLFRTGE